MLQMTRAGGARRRPPPTRAGLLALTLWGALGCAHQASPASGSSPAAASAPAKDPSPGARTEGERTHVLEAQWDEVVVKARKDGGTVVSAVKLVQPKIRIFHAAASPADERTAADKARTDAAQPPEVIDLAQLLRKITPLDIDHIDILDGQVAFVDTSRKERPELWMHELHLSVENLPTRVRLTEGRPILLTASAVLARSGQVSIFITADPFEKGLTFSGRAAVVGLQTAELYRFIEPATNMQAARGTVDIFVEFDCRNGELTGGIKPVLKDIEIRPDDKKVFTVLKAWVTDVAIKLFSDRVPDRKAVATVIPIKGTLTGPDVQLWPAIFGVMRNAFVEALTSGYAYLPPPTAEKKQGVVTQGVKALSESGPKPPSAQPREGGERAPPPPPATSSPTQSPNPAPGPAP
jgi:hypothetical protein